MHLKTQEFIDIVSNTNENAFIIRNENREYIDEKNDIQLNKYKDTINKLKQNKDNSFHLIKKYTENNDGIIINYDKFNGSYEKEIIKYNFNENNDNSVSLYNIIKIYENKIIKSKQNEIINAYKSIDYKKIKHYSKLFKNIKNYNINKKTIIIKPTNINILKKMNYKYINEKNKKYNIINNMEYNKFNNYGYYKYLKKKEKINGINWPCIYYTNKCIYYLYYP